VRALPFQLPENFLLIVRAMSLTSGVCSALDPDFNLWDAVEPYAAQLVRDEGGNAVRDVLERGAAIAGTLARMPGRLEKLVARVEEGQVSFTDPRLERRVGRLEQVGRRLPSSIMFAGLVVGGALVRPEDGVLGGVLLVASVVPLLHAVFAGRGR
jgi:predicted unusual protein kinase regulating ubiquinone biosynthesis (AarF/ABC1/UbiB family)